MSRFIWIPYTIGVSILMRLRRCNTALGGCILLISSSAKRKTTFRPTSFVSVRYANLLIRARLLYDTRSEMLLIEEEEPSWGKKSA
ncbi:hypothetical protein DL98DRAFT_215405 [Cadophora sp. DSE1049]|nr:hypothetical protein DL98DRAFT_215405 [Cadophora sp. DSE1049]